MIFLPPNCGYRERFLCEVKGVCVCVCVMWKKKREVEEKKKTLHCASGGVVKKITLKFDDSFLMILMQKWCHLRITTHKKIPPKLTFSC